MFKSSEHLQRVVEFKSDISGGSLDDLIFVGDCPSDKWSPSKPVSLLPAHIRDYFVDRAELLYDELYSRKLTVVLAPAPEPRHAGHMVRVVEETNPNWYSDLYCENVGFRRDLSLRSLDRIRFGVDMASGSSRGCVGNMYRYDEIYRTLILDQLINGFVFDWYRLVPENEVREFFGFSAVQFEDECTGVPF